MRPTAASSAWVGVGIVVLVALSAFLGCFGVGYFADDFVLLGAVAEGVEWRAPLPVGSGGYFRPLSLASFLPGDLPRLQHGLNLLLHLGNGLLVLAIARLAGCRPVLATAVALVFLLHPLVVTDVYWLAARSDSLCALFYLGGVLAFLGYLLGGRAGLLWVTGGALVLSVLAKETGLTLVPALAAVWLLFRAGEPRAHGGSPVPPPLPPDRHRAAGRALLALAAVTVLLAGFLASVYWLRAPGTFRQGPAGPFGVLLVAANAVVLRIDEYDLRRWGLAYPWLRWAGAAAGAALAAWAAALALRLEGRRGLLRLGLLAALPLAPLLPLVAIGWARERLVYLPWALGVVAVALFLGRGRDHLQRRAAWAGLALVPLLAWASIARGAVWRDNAAYLERACATFRELASGAPEDLPLLVVTAPFSRAEAPLYSNDPAQALGHCLTGGFEAPDRLHVYSGLALAEAAAEPHRALEATDHPEERAFRRRSLPEASHFRLLLDQRPGPHQGDGLAELLVKRTAPAGDVTAFELRLEPGARALVLDLGPDGFREVARYE